MSLLKTPSTNHRWGSEIMMLMIDFLLDYFKIYFLPFLMKIPLLVSFTLIPMRL